MKTETNIPPAVGAVVDREWTTVPGFANHPTRCCRYWLDAENRERAARLLGLGYGA